MPPSSSSKSASLGSIRSLYSPMVTVRVGAAKQAFCIHKDVLCFNSKYFTKALSGQFLEARTHIVELEDVHVMLFKIFVAWLYTGKLNYESSDLNIPAKNDFEQLHTILTDEHPYEQEDDEEDRDDGMPIDEFFLYDFDQEDPETWTYLILCALFVLADRLDVPKLKTLALDTIIGRRRNKGPIPNASAVLYTYAHTTRNSKLRRLLVHTIAYEVEFKQSHHVWNHWPLEFLTAVMVTNGRRLPAKQCESCFDNALSDNQISDHVIDDVDRTEDKPPFRRDLCFYHEHKDEEEKEACRAEREKQSGSG
ncbi:hypothetical protein D6C90_00907 [Aureobasidium pullulans]|uniref:BTB domain-containing protein n=1 Tax=Aureobasidium pullulans TaxID=5580 RepID=A0A4S9VMF5_AURPU|nr:hypothetical protein D6C90_00907 [Aureobasidium pullulans]